MALRLRRKEVIKITLTFWPKVRKACEKKPYTSKHNWRQHSGQRNSHSCIQLWYQSSLREQPQNPLWISQKCGVTYECGYSDIGQYIPLILCA